VVAVLHRRGEAHSIWGSGKLNSKVKSFLEKKKKGGKEGDHSGMQGGGVGRRKKEGLEHPFIGGGREGTSLTLIEGGGIKNGQTPFKKKNLLTPGTTNFNLAWGRRVE